jgi:hypothetical protein
MADESIEGLVADDADCGGRDVDPAWGQHFAKSGKGVWFAADAQEFRHLVYDADDP